MSAKAEVFKLEQATKVPDSPDANWLDDRKKEYKKYEDMERETLAKVMWNKGKILFEVQKRYVYNKQKGFVKLVEEEFERSIATAYNYINIYRACPTPELLECFPTWLLRMVGSENFHKELREYIIKNPDKLKKEIKKKDIGEAVLKELSAKFKMIGFDSDSPDLKGLFEEREKKAKEYNYRQTIDRDLRALDKLWNAFDAAARTGLKPDEEDENVWLTEKQEQLPIVKKLKELGYLPKYKVFVETDVSND